MIKIFMTLLITLQYVGNKKSGDFWWSFLMSKTSINVSTITLI